MPLAAGFEENENIKSDNKITVEDIEEEKEETLQITEEDTEAELLIGATSPRQTTQIIEKRQMLEANFRKERSNSGKRFFKEYTMFTRQDADQHSSNVHLDEEPVSIICQNIGSYMGGEKSPWKDSGTRKSNVT